MHCSIPNSTGGRPGTVLARRNSTTWAAHSTKLIPRRPSGAGTSLRSRCVWALIKPGKIATLPRSMTLPPAGPAPTAAIRSPEIVTVPSARGGPLTGKT